MAQSGPDSSLADRVLDYGEQLVHGVGDHRGQPFRWMDFQVSFIQDTFLDDWTVEIANLSVGRGGGKTATCAVLAMATVDMEYGPLYRPSELVISASRSHKQASLIYKWAFKTAHASGIDGRFKWTESVKSFTTHPNLAAPDEIATFMAISADATTALGERPWLVFHDELGSVEGPTDSLYESLSTGATLANTLEVNISTQAATDDALFSGLLDAGLSGEDPTIVSHLYAADVDDDPLDEETWRKANPGLGVSVNIKTMRKKAERAAAMPSRMVSFEHLNLNKRQEHGEVWIGSHAWRQCGDPAELEVLQTGRVWGGLDLSGRRDLTALVLLAEAQDRRLHAFAYGWTPRANLLERSQGAWNYADLVDRGLLRTCPGSSIDLAIVAREIEEITADLDLRYIAYDRWQITHLRREFELIESRLAWADDDDSTSLLRPCGQGAKDMGPAIEWTEHLVTTQQICHGGNPLLATAMTSAVVDRDHTDKGIRINKKKSTVKIDPAVALAMACRAARFEVEDDGPYWLENGIAVLSNH